MKLKQIFIFFHPKIFKDEIRKYLGFVRTMFAR